MLYEVITLQDAPCGLGVVIMFAARPGGEGVGLQAKRLIDLGTHGQLPPNDGHLSHGNGSVRK